MKTKKKHKRRSYYLSLLHFFIGGFFKIKYWIRKPKAEIKEGLYPASYAQEQLLARANLALSMQGIKGRQARRVIEKKLRIKVIPQNNGTNL